MSWPAAILSGILAGAITVTASVSLAALIFVGDLSVFLNQGIHLALITAVIIGFMVSLMGSCGVAIAIPQDRTAPILAIMAAGIVAGAPAGMPADQVMFNVIVAIVAATLVTGVFLVVLGATRAGGLMRFIPYSVLAGFFAGTGWLLVVGGLRVMTGLDLTAPAGMIALADPDFAVRWVPGVVLALAIIGASRIVSYAAALPLALAGASALFFLLMFSAGETLMSLGEAGWLLSTPATTEPVASGLIHLQGLGAVDWELLAGQWASIGTILVISAVSILLTASALELLSGQEIDFNRELRVAGLANIAAGFSGGMVGFHSLSISSLVIRLGGRTRMVGIVAAFTCGLVLLFGAQIISALPRLVVGGLLLFLGFSFLGQWLFATYRQLPRGEYLVIPLIIVVVAALGFVSGVLIGLLAALVIFVLNYSRTPVIRYALSGDQAKSSVQRSVEDEHLLRTCGRQTLLLKLRGYLFFGTMAQLSGRILERAADPSLPPLRFAVLDFEQVAGVDSSASYAFQRLIQTGERKGFVLVLTGIGADLERSLKASGLAGHVESLRWFGDLDHGLEWIENRFLLQGGNGEARVSRPIIERVSEHFPDGAGAAEFSAYLTEISFPAGHELIRQGDASGDMYFLEEGEVSVYLRLPDGSSVRILRTGAGTVVGELGFYLGTPRTAAVVADRPGRAYRLSTAALQRMEAEHPEYAAALHRFMADHLAERLLNTTQTLKAVLD